MSLSPWGKVSAPTPVNLTDIMSEEVAKDLQAKENRKYLPEVVKSPVESDLVLVDEAIAVELVPDDEKLLTDQQIAKILQQQFDKEHDDILKRTEEKINGTSKVSVSFDNYRRAPLNDDFDSDSDEEELEDLRDRKNWDRFDEIEKEYKTMPASGYKVQSDGKMITKHDMTMSGRINACKLMNLSPEFNSGDGAGFDLQISNKVFNRLRAHSKEIAQRRHRMRDVKQDRATAEFGMDEYTRLLLYKLINKQLLTRVNGVISVGKEAVVLHADTDPAYEECLLPAEAVIKVFKTTLSEYKQRDKYIRDDYRFKDRFGCQNTRGMVHLWAEKEMHNLKRLEKANIPCPRVLALKKHMLVMSFIGIDHNPAPKLKYAILSDRQLMEAYYSVVASMKSLYRDANLIHADLSEYNILYFQETCYFIDVSQSVEPQHENAFVFLKRDCENIVNFFRRKQLAEVATPEELFLHIVGVPFENKVLLSELQQSHKSKPHLVDVPGKECIYKFDSAWSKTIETEQQQQQIVIENGQKTIEKEEKMTENDIKNENITENEMKSTQSVSNSEIIVK